MTTYKVTKKYMGLNSLSLFLSLSPSLPPFLPPSLPHSLSLSLSLSPSLSLSLPLSPPLSLIGMWLLIMRWMRSVESGRQLRTISTTSRMLTAS